MTGSSAHSCSSPCPVPGPTARHGAVGPRIPKPHGEPSFVAVMPSDVRTRSPNGIVVTPSKDPTDVPPSRDVQAIPDPYRDTPSEDGVIDGVVHRRGSAISASTPKRSASVRFCRLADLRR